MSLLPIDFHSHVHPAISTADLQALNAVVFAATPSLAAASRALERDDMLTIWGVGCHPSLVRSQTSFDPAAFRLLCRTSPFVGEVGLDGESRVPLTRQLEVLRFVLEALRTGPRIISLHSYRATGELVRLLADAPVSGAILHWWLGSVEETREAVRLGCFFSVNPSSVRRLEILSEIPLSRILTETDHPAGDRFLGSDSRPGNVVGVERALGRHYRLSPARVREQMWRNLDSLVSETDTAALLPRPIRLRLATL